MSVTAHLYVHIPFCQSKCPYCAFVTHVGSLKLVEPYLEALRREASLVRNRHAGGPLQSVYFGGGTPSLLTPSQISGLLDEFARLFGIAAGAEITLEAHPDTVDRVTLSGYRVAGVTRLSLGGESFDPRVLRRIGRSHGPDRVAEVVGWARESRFESINIDLMYGLPGQSRRSWRETVRRAVAIGPEHLSLYPLSVEPKTVFGRQSREHGLRLPSDDAVVSMYHEACRLLSDADYEHYEIANWSRPGHTCRHNLAVWRNAEYYGLGVGAHAYLRPFRTANVTQVRRYLELVAGDELPIAGREPAGADDDMNDTIMLRLRLLREGLDLEEIRRSYGVDLAAERAAALEPLLAHGLLQRQEGALRLTERGVPLTNEVLALLC